MLPKKSAMKNLVFILFTIITMTANAQSIDESFARFSACDAIWFQKLEQEKHIWMPVTSFESGESASRLVVKDRKDSKFDRTKFSSRVTIAGMPAIAYVDTISDLGSSGQYYYWGFIFKGSVNEVAAKLKPLVHDGNRLRQDKDVWVRTELKLPNSDSWLKRDTFSGSVPVPFTTERVLIIDMDDKEPDTVSVFCSLQGNVPPKVLSTNRPDIAMSDYLASQTQKLFDVTPNDVRSVDLVKKIMAEKPFWQPKFKQIRYTSVWTKGSSPLAIEVILTKNPDHLITAIEDMNIFVAQRSLFASAVQLKSRLMGLQPDSVYVSTIEEFEVPDMLSPGAKYSFKTTSRYTNSGSENSPKLNSKTCVATKIISAQKIHKNISGDAVLLTCQIEENGKISTEGKAFIVDLGVELSYEEPSGLFGKPIIEYTKFDVI